MKILTYKIEGYANVQNPETGEIERQLTLATVTVENPTDEDIAKAVAIAYNGEYTVEDDGMTEAQPTDAQRIAQLEEALDLLLSGVTE